MTARDPTSIMAVLERGLTLAEDCEAPPAHEMSDPTAVAAAVSPSHEHVARALPPGHRPPLLHGELAGGLGHGEAVGGATAGGEGAEMTLHPPALAGIAPGGEEREHAAAGGVEDKQVTLREQLAGAAKVSRERVRKIEQELLAAVRRSATVYTTKEQVLQKLLQQVDSGMGELGVRDVRQVRSVCWAAGRSCLGSLP